MTDFRPLGDRVLIEPDDAPDQTDSGIIIARRYKDPAVSGTIVALGQGRFSRKGVPLPREVAVGDEVAFATSAGQEITVDGKPYIVLREDDLLGTLTETNGEAP